MDNAALPRPGRWGKQGQVRTRLSEISKSNLGIEKWATLHTEKTAEVADLQGLSPAESPIIALSQIQRLDFGRISLTDVISYAKPTGVQNNKTADSADQDHIHIAASHLPNVSDASAPDQEGGLFARTVRGKRSKGNRATPKQRRAISVPITASRSLVSAYLSSVATETGRSVHTITGFQPLTPYQEAIDSATCSTSREQRIANRSSWLLRKEAERGNTWKILELLQAGVLASSRDDCGRTPCHYAAMNNHSKAIAALANPNQNSYVPHNFEDAAQDGSRVLHYAAFNGCTDAADAIIKLHRAQIQADRFRQRDADAERLRENRRRLLQNKSELESLSKLIEELEGEEYELTTRIQHIQQSSELEDARFQNEHDQLRYVEKQAEETLEAHALQCEKLEQTVAHWKPISKAKYEMYASELETAKKELTSLEMSLIEAVSAVEKESKAHGKTARKLSRQLYQDQQRLNEVQEQLEEKRGAEETETALNKQLMEEHKTLSASVTEFSRKVVHVCRGPHHVEFNADIHGQAANGSTPLHWAADSGQDRMCHLLLACGADPNAPDAQGLTALHWCAIGAPHANEIPEQRVAHRYLETGFELLVKGAKCNAVDELGCSPLHYAAASGFTEFIEVLKEWGGDPSMQNKDGLNPVHYAMANAHLDSALALVAGVKDIYACIHVQDRKGMSPLHYANVNGYEDLAALLVLRCNEMQLEHNQESIRQARMGIRDAKHKAPSQLVGSHVFTGSTIEHMRYYHSASLEPTRKRGWTRNDLIHNVGEQAFRTTGKKRDLSEGDLFEALSSSITKIAARDDADMMNLTMTRGARSRDRGGQGFMPAATLHTLPFLPASAPAPLARGLTGHQ